MGQHKLCCFVQHAQKKVSPMFYPKATRAHTKHRVLRHDHQLLYLLCHAGSIQATMLPLLNCCTCFARQGSNQPTNLPCSANGAKSAPTQHYCCCAQLLKIQQKKHLGPQNHADTKSIDRLMLLQYEYVSLFFRRRKQKVAECRAVNGRA